jgi:hypothetical protein
LVVPPENSSVIVGTTTASTAAAAAAAASIPPVGVGGDGRSDHAARTREQEQQQQEQEQQEEEEADEEAAERSGQLKPKLLGEPVKKRTASGDYLWGCIATEDTPLLPSLSAPSDIVSAGDAPLTHAHPTRERPGATEQQQHHHEQQQQQREKVRVEHSSSSGTSYGGNDGRHHTELSKKEATVAVGDAKKPKKKRLSLRVFSPLGYAEHTAHTSTDGGTQPGVRSPHQ